MAEKKTVQSKTCGLYEALIKAAQKFPDMSKDGQGNFGKYGTLPATLKAVRGPLAAHGLILTQPVRWVPEAIDNDTGETRPGQAYQQTILTHAPSGEQLLSEVPLNTAQSEQGVGKSMTYYRRYLACGLLGIAFSDEEDLDDKDPAVDLMSSSPLLPLDELRLMSVKMAETAYGKDHPDLKGLAGVIRKAAAVQAGISRPNSVTEIAKFSAAMGSVTLGFDDCGDPMIAAEPDRATGPDPLLQSICEGELDPADMPITPLDAKKGEQG